MPMLEMLVLWNQHFFENPIPRSDYPADNLTMYEICILTSAYFHNLYTISNLLWKFNQGMIFSSCNKTLFKSYTQYLVCVLINPDYGEYFGFRNQQRFQPVSNKNSIFRKPDNVWNLHCETEIIFNTIFSSDKCVRNPTMYKFTFYIFESWLCMQFVFSQQNQIKPCTQ